MVRRRLGDGIGEYCIVEGGGESREGDIREDEGGGVDAIR